jgi:hypothetical protein
VAGVAKESCEEPWVSSSAKSVGLEEPIGKDFEKSNIDFGRSGRRIGSCVGDSSAMLEADEDCVIVRESGWGG